MLRTHVDFTERDVVLKLQIQNRSKYAKYDVIILTVFTASLFFIILPCLLDDSSGGCLNLHYNSSYVQF